jgi:hypothetical protein
MREDPVPENGKTGEISHILYLLAALPALVPIPSLENRPHGGTAFTLLFTVVLVLCTYVLRRRRRHQRATLAIPAPSQIPPQSLGEPGAGRSSLVAPIRIR